MKIIILSLVASSVIWADTISLQEILNHASNNAKTLQIKQIDALIASTNVQSAESAYYPSLNFVYNGEYTQALDGSSFGTESVGGVNISNSTRYQTSMALQLNYDLYHFGSTDKRVNIASSEVDIKNVEWCLQEKQLHHKILEDFTSARKAIIDKKYRTQMLDLRKKLYTLKERLYNAGQYSKIDLGNEAIQIITLERDIEESSMQYKEKIIKLSQMSRMELSDDVELLPLDIKREENLVEKYDDTTQGLLLNKRISQKKEEISLQSREQLPSLGLYSNYYLYGTHPKEYDYTIENIDKKSWNIGLSLRYNIFEGFKHSSAQERLKLELQRLEQEFEEAKHVYSYETKSKTTRIKELEALKEHEQHLLEENYIKRDMLNRLREKQKVDFITQLNSEYEVLERALNIEIRNIYASFESVSLSILHRGINECSPH